MTYIGQTKSLPDILSVIVLILRRKRSCEISEGKASKGWRKSNQKDIPIYIGLNKDLVNLNKSGLDK